LAAGLNGEAFTRRERVVMVVTAGIAPWNMCVAYLAGLLLDVASRRRLVNLDA
jgi:hypothetical protein